MFSQFSALVTDKPCAEYINKTLYNGGVIKESSSNNPEYSEIVVGACERHKEHLIKLFELTNKHRTITATMVEQARNALTPQEFTNTTKCRAYDLWEKKEKIRSHRNWMDAISQLSERLGHFPNTYEINCLARGLWRDRKDNDALEDWLEAEIWMREHFPIIL